VTLTEWLEDRRPAMPAALRRAVRDVVARAEAAGVVDPDAPVPDRLAECALHALGVVVRAEADRAMAAELLAADALLTYACEAAAEAGPAELDRVTGRFDEGRIGALLEQVRQ
jgi:hypothetical protein